MKLINFKISNDNIGLETFDQRYFDLHNNYDLESITYKFGERHFEINWKKTVGNWVDKNAPTKLRLKFSNVEILRFKEVDKNQGNLSDNKDDKVLSLIGFTNKEDREFISCIPNSIIKNEDLALTIQTENDQGIIIYCEKIELEINEI